MRNPSHPAIILLQPQLGENIGAVARAMSNFGLSDLRLVTPRDGWPNVRAQEVAAGAAHIIEAAQVFPSFSAAMHDIAIAYATTARPRELEKRVITPAAAVGEMCTEISKGRRCAIAFGPERTGMLSDDIVLCDTIVTIPTDVANSSLNLAQSAVVMGYEWWQASQNTASGTHTTLGAPAPKIELQGVLEHLEQVLDDIEYFRTDEKKSVMWRNLQNIFVRSQLTSQEVRTLRGILRSLQRVLGKKS